MSRSATVLRDARRSTASSRRATSTSVRTNWPLAPASLQGLGLSRNAGPAMSMWAQGVLPTNCSRNLAAVIAPPQRPSPTFLMSATSLLISSSYISGIHRQLPDRLAARAGRGHDRVAPGLIVGHHAGHFGAQRHDAGAGERGQVDDLAAPRSTASDSTSASTSRPSASVLWTSIVRPLRAVQHVAQLHRRRPGHVFDQPRDADDVDRQLQLCDGLHRADHRRGAGLVALHGEHAVGRLERQAAGVERHAFADDGQRRRVLAGAAVAQDHQPRRAARALGHGQQRAAAFGLQPLLDPRFRFPGRFARRLRRLAAANVSG